ncbi:MAG: hypothetical protein ACJ72N_08610 [Labedaea sp.]
MSADLETALTVVALACAVWGLVLVILDRAPNRPLLGVLLLLELGLLVQAVIGVVALVGTDRQVSAVTFVGYLVGSLVVLPLAVFWAMAERTRWGTTVLIVACLVVPVMIVRMDQVWGNAG